MLVNKLMIKSNWDKILPKSAKDSGEIHKRLMESKVFYIPNIDDIHDAVNTCLDNTEALKQLFRLPHDPMVIEIADAQNNRACFLVWQALMAPGHYNLGYFSSSDYENGIDQVGFSVFNAESIKNEGGRFYVGALSNEVLGKKIDSTHPHEAVARVQILMGVVALINSPKIIELENVSTDKINKHRIKKNKPPLVSHSIIKLQKHVKAQQKASAGTGEGVALHWRRGHFKAKPKGMTWWNPHVVGKKELGEVVSGYLMQTN